MPKITVFKRNADGRLPWNFRPLSPEEEAAWVRPELLPREARDLVKEGVWAPEGTPEAAHNWLRPGEGGEIWAGNQEGPRALVAKVRGKAGRITGGNRIARVPEEAKVRTTSIQMAPALREELEAITATLQERRGKRVTISNIVQELISQALPTYKAEHDLE